MVLPSIYNNEKYVKSDMISWICIIFRQTAMKIFKSVIYILSQFYVMLFLSFRIDLVFYVLC